MRTIRRKTGKAKKRILIRVLAAVLLLFFLAAAAGAYAVHKIAESAPPLSLDDVTPDRYYSTVLDQSGERILNLTGAESNRVYVTLDEIPDDLKNAVIAIEDRRFYEHDGVDMRGFLRAAVRNLLSGSLSEGASTITQQLVKNNVLTGWTGERTAADKIARKIREQKLALELEERTDKDWILENYLNTINLGRGAWGVEAASVRYFGKHVQKLTLSECAALAAVIKSPSGLEPIGEPEANNERRLTVLSYMLDAGTITRAQYDEAAADDVYARIREENVPAGAETFSYFEDAMLRQVVGDMKEKLSLTEDEAWKLLYTGGLTIETTQDSRLQRICEEEVNNASHYTGGEQATVVVIEQATGEVKAIVGGRGDKNASLVYDRASFSVRQPGSTIKIVGEYAAALDLGSVTLATVYDDAPCTYSDGTAVHNATGGYVGRTTVRDAIRDSTNVPALLCFREVGEENVWPYLQSCGFEHLTDEDRVEALALGGTHGGVTNRELTAAYAAVANGGVYREPVFYTRVLDRSGETLLKRESEERRIVDERTAALLTSAMCDVMTSGTGMTANIRAMSLAGKSGTTNARVDQWFMGFSSAYTCGVWGGFDDNMPSHDGLFVKSIWRAVMRRAHEGVETTELTTPDNLMAKMICTKCGKLAILGVCDQTVQGDKTRVEYFVPGTEPTETCDCHERVNICTASGCVAGPYCPVSLIETNVYLKEGTKSTPDAHAVYQGTEETCALHASHWSLFFSHTPESGWEEPSDVPSYPYEDPWYEAPAAEPERPERPRRFWEDWFI